SALAEDRPVIRLTTDRAAQDGLQRLASRLGLQSPIDALLVVPLRSEGRLVGALHCGVVGTGPGEAFAREAVDLVTSVARQAAVLIRRIQVRMSSERAGTLLRRLVEVEQTLHPEMGVKALLAAIVEAAVRLMGARTGGAFVNHRERRELEARVLLPPLPEGLL